MARLAVAVEYAVVIVIILVTVDAVGFCIQELLRLMTIVALDIAVLTQQWEPRQVMVKKRHIQPVCLRMTVAALFAELTFMRIIFAVTIDTFGPWGRNQH